MIGVSGVVVSPRPFSSITSSPYVHSHPSSSGHGYLALLQAHTNAPIIVDQKHAAWN